MLARVELALFCVLAELTSLVEQYNNNTSVLPALGCAQRAK